MADRARQITDKKLKAMEAEIGRIYSSSPALKRVEKEYMDYMAMVEKSTKASYLAFKKEDNIEHREELKKVYMDEIKALTIYSKHYKRIIHRITKAIAEVNQQALDVVNDSMAEIYAVNYNQVAVDCKKVGIKVNG